MRGVSAVLRVRAQLPQLQTKPLASAFVIARPFAARSAAKAEPPFSTVAARLLERLETGLLPLKEANHGLIVEASPTDLVVVTSGGARTHLHVNSDTARVELTAPPTSFSGGGEQHYRWDAAQGEWIDEVDGHLLFDKLTRDLIA